MRQDKKAPQKRGSHPHRYDAEITTQRNRLRGLVDSSVRAVLGLVVLGLLMVFLLPAIQMRAVQWLVTGIGFAAMWVLVIDLCFPVDISDLIGLLARRNTDNRDR